jgi:iron complex outermembrane receptor protein
VIPPFSPLNATPAPLGVEIWGDPNFAPEKLQAFELGVRHRFDESFSLDFAAYYNKYSDIRGVRLLPAVCAPSFVVVVNNPLCVLSATKIIVPMQFSNLLSGSIRGAELTATWSPTRQWRLIASYAYLEHDFDENPVDFGLFQLDFAELAAGLDARNQWTLRSNLSLNAHWDWDIMLRHVDALPTSEAPAYTEATSRIAWRPRTGFELAVVGENLLHADHREFVSDFVDLAPVSIKRNVRLQARWSF